MEGTPYAADESVRALWEKFRASRDPLLRERLINRYLDLARTTAARFFRLRSDDSVPFADYQQYARIGLVEAIDDYDPNREASFETYSSYRIRGAVLNGLGRESETAAQRSFWRTRTQERVDIPAAAISTGNETAAECTDRSDCDAASDHEDETRDELEPLRTALALGFLLERDNEEIADEAVQANPHAAAEQAELLHRVRGAIERLPGRERELIRRHYLEQCEFRVIARELAVTPGRVSQLHAQALVRIRELLQDAPE